MSKPWDLNSLLDCVRDDLHPDQIRSLLREAFDAGQRWAVQALRVEAGYIASLGGSDEPLLGVADLLAQLVDLAAVKGKP